MQKRRPSISFLFCHENNQLKCGLSGKKEEHLCCVGKAIEDQSASVLCWGVNLLSTLISAGNLFTVVI
jgi:hypothetical protein